MPSRRHFVQSLVGASAALPMFRDTAMRHAARATQRLTSADPAAAADDEAYWGEIQRAFDADRHQRDQPRTTAASLSLDRQTHVLRGDDPRPSLSSSELPVYHMWTVLEPRIESVRRDLAADFGCDPEEMAITRNASEGLETLIFGMDLRRGDEVIVTNQNYGRMLTSWNSRTRRHGIVVKQVAFPVPPPSQDYLVDIFRKAITPKTRIIEVTHITNLTGQIFPVREIVQMAHEHNVEVFVDGAHAYAHFPFKRDDLGADYYGTSLHKWLLAPIGTGFLYVRKAKIAGMWPLMAAPPAMDDNIRKYEEIGTHPAANHNAISAALAFHRAIGSERKIARLRYLRDRWAKRLLATSDRVKVPTQIDTPYSGAIALVSVEGLDASKFSTWLLDKHRIVTTPINHAEFSGLRITPNVYTTVDEVDTFADTVLGAIKNGIA